MDFLIGELCIVPGMAILDVGCGTVRHAIELAQRGFRVTGVDVSKGMLNEARQNAAQKGVDVEWIESDAKDFSLPGQFDAAICLCEGAFGLFGSTDDPIGQPQSIIRNIAESMKTKIGCQPEQSPKEQPQSKENSTISIQSVALLNTRYPPALARRN